MVHPDNEQEGVGGDYRQVGTCRWTGGSTSDGRGGVGGVDWANSGGHRLEEGGEGRMGSQRKSIFRGELNSGVWTETKFMTRGDRLVGLEKEEPWLLLAVVLSHFYPLLLGGRFEVEASNSEADLFPNE